MSDQALGAATYIKAVKSHLSEMVKGRVLVEGNDIVIETKEFGKFRTTFDVWEKMICGIPSKDVAEVICKQYRKFVLNRTFKI